MGWGWSEVWGGGGVRCGVGWSEVWAGDGVRCGVGCSEAWAGGGVRCRVGVVRDLEGEQVVSCRGMERSGYGVGGKCVWGENSQGSWSSCLTHWEVCTHLNRSTPAQHSTVEEQGEASQRQGIIGKRHVMLYKL